MNTKEAVTTQASHLGGAKVMNRSKLGRFNESKKLPSFAKRLAESSRTSPSSYSTEQESTFFPVGLLTLVGLFCRSFVRHPQTKFIILFTHVIDYV